ncbi:serine/threonine-protein kinase pim-2-like [Eucyclogobius newberryi]|uniref:serine/threonine-protein kinase pim-2-like n=1 Tax=Eucyclogobius newberryi TaxID=166745 RepID=UPI003B5A6766
MSNGRRSCIRQRVNCKAGWSPTLKKTKPVKTNLSKQRHVLTQLAAAGILDVFNATYEQGHELGSGGFGSVYNGVRKSDGLKVAIKHVPKNNVDFHSVDRKELLQVPMEVHLMSRAAGGPDKLGQSAAVSLLDWFMLDTELIIVMERPFPSMDLLAYSTLHYPLPEDTVRDIMKQLVLAVIDLHKKGVFHRDLKPNNVLIQKTEDGIRVRIIDFGHGCVASAAPHTSILGCLSCAPLEMFLVRQYRDGPTSVWQIGAMAFNLLNGDGCCFDTSEWVLNKLSMKTSTATEEGKHFVQVCLENNPANRMSLEELAKHPWFSKT